MLYESEYYGICSFGEALSHHGIKGQKWGIRRFQNPDGSLTEAGKIRYKGFKRKQNLIQEQLGIGVSLKQLNIRDKNESERVHKKAGEKVYHVTPLDFKELRDGQDLFISASDYDRNMYKSFLSLMLRHKGFDKVREVEMTLKTDLNAPSNKDQRRMFSELYSSNKRMFDSDISDYYKKKGKKQPENAYDAFIPTLDRKQSKSKEAFYNKLKAEGYNAVLDQHDVDRSWMQAGRPLIVMDAANVLGNVKSSQVKTKDIENSLTELGILKRR